MERSTQDPQMVNLVLMTTWDDLSPAMQVTIYESIEEMGADQKQQARAKLLISWAQERVVAKRCRRKQAREEKEDQNARDFLREHLMNDCQGSEALLQKHHGELFKPEAMEVDYATPSDVETAQLFLRQRNLPTECLGWWKRMAQGQPAATASSSINEKEAPATKAATVEPTAATCSLSQLQVTAHEPPFMQQMAQSRPLPYSKHSESLIEAVQDESCLRKRGRPRRESIERAYSLLSQKGVLAQQLDPQASPFTRVKGERCSAPDRTPSSRPFPDIPTSFPPGPPGRVAVSGRVVPLKLDPWEAKIKEFDDFANQQLEAVLKRLHDEEDADVTPPPSPQKGRFPPLTRSGAADPHERGKPAHKKPRTEATVTILPDADADLPRSDNWHDGASKLARDSGHPLQEKQARVPKEVADTAPRAERGMVRESKRRESFGVGKENLGARGSEHAAGGGSNTSGETTYNLDGLRSLAAEARRERGGASQSSGASAYGVSGLATLAQEAREQRGGAASSGDTEYNLDGLAALAAQDKNLFRGVSSGIGEPAPAARGRTWQRHGSGGKTKPDCRPTSPATFTRSGNGSSWFADPRGRTPREHPRGGSEPAAMPQRSAREGGFDAEGQQLPHRPTPSAPAETEQSRRVARRPGGKAWRRGVRGSVRTAASATKPAGGQ